MFLSASRKEPKQYVSLFRHCPSPAKRPWELAYHTIGHVLLRHPLDLQNTNGWLGSACNQGLFPIPLVIELQFVAGCHQEELATMWLCGPKVGD